MSELLRIKNEWAKMQDFMDWSDFITQHEKVCGRNTLSETIINELLELAIK